MAGLGILEVFKPFFNKGLYLFILIGGLSFSVYAQTEKPQHRIIALSPHLAEMAASAGALNQLVGVVSYSDYPNAVTQLPIVGSYNAINFEKILQLQPDIVLTWQGGNRPQDLLRLKQLGQQLGFKLFLSHPQKLSDIPKEIAAIGKLAGTEAVASAQAEKLRQQLSQQQQRYQNTPQIKWIKTFYEIWHSPLMTINGQHFISQAMAICKGKNIFADLRPVAGEVSIEAVIVRNPEVILLGGNRTRQQEWKKMWQSYPMIEAVKTHRIIPLNADLYQRPTARLIQNLPDLCLKIQGLHAP